MINKFTESERAHCKAICTNEIEAGDKVHLRCGSVLVVTGSPGALEMAGFFVEEWNPLDIIRIEKAPKPVVETYWFAAYNGFCEAFSDVPAVCKMGCLYKITITDGVLVGEKVK